MRTCIHCGRTEAEAHFAPHNIAACMACLSPEAVRDRIDRLPDGLMKRTLIGVGLDLGIVDEREGDR